MKQRDYQEKHITGIAVALTKYRKVCGQLATGGGKTVEFCGISYRYIHKAKKRVLILVHRKELLQQTRQTAYNAYDLTCEPIEAGMKYIPEADIYVGMVESVVRRIAKLKDIGLVIIDECHIASFNKVIQHFPTQYIIGFSATPLSNNKKHPVKEYYDEIVCGVDIPELIKAGHLCQNITYAPKDTVDRLELGMRGDDFDEQQMGIAFSRPKYIHNTVSAYERWAKGTKTIVFNVNVFHSKEVTKAFTEAGYNCRHIDGSMNKERAEILHWFKHTPDAILCNVGIATTGFDEPTIETVVVNKATMSMPLWLQMDGRGSRPTEAKSVFTIIDMGGNAVIHGDWCQSRNWHELFHNPPKPGKPTAAPVKSCPKCEAIVPAGAKQCPYCEYVFPTKEIPIEAELQDFIVITKGIDVEKLVRDNLHRKQHYPFFKIGNDLAVDAKKTIPQMTDDFAIFILERYFVLAKTWAKTQGKRFNQWYKAKAKEHLFEQLTNHYPEWQPQQTTLSASIAELTA